MNEGEIGVICLTVQDAEKPLPTSVIRWCEVCAADVWVAPSSLALMEQHKVAHIYCTGCMDGVAATQDELDIREVPGGERTNDPAYQAMVRAAQKRWGK